jgi:hypothetical protein
VVVVWWTGNQYEWCYCLPYVILHSRVRRWRGTSFSLGLCASLAGYFTLLSLTNLATVFMFFKLPNLVVCFQETPTFHIHEHCNNMTSRFFLKSLMCVWLHLNMCMLVQACVWNFIESGLSCLYYASSYYLMDLLLYGFSNPSFYILVLPQFWLCVLNSAIWLHQWGFSSFGVLDLRALICTLWDLRKTCRILS